MAQIWQVVGGRMNGGIVVREGRSLKSKEVVERLSFGSLVEQRELNEEFGRLHFKRISGTGPQEGWVSLKLKDNVLVKRAEEKDPSGNSGVARAAEPAAAKEPTEKMIQAFEPVGLIFPGQGSQYVKMMADVKDLPAVKEMLEKAVPILGFDILDLCLNGPEEKLAETRYCQPAMFIGGLAGLEKLRLERPAVADTPRYMAGLSLGEYTALCAAGVFSFEDGLRLVKLRGEAMQDAATDGGKQLMLSVAGLEGDVLRTLCEKTEREAGPGETCRVANELFPKGYACGGTEKAIEQLTNAVTEAGALQAKVLKTSGAFHTPLMEPAQKRLANALEETLPKMRPPRCALMMNATGEEVPAGTEPEVIVENLKKQLTNPVLWERSVRGMIAQGVTEYYEVGPMKQLTAMMKRIDQTVWKTTNKVDV